MSETDPLHLVGKTIADKYAVDNMVGEGGFAVVYRATHMLWKRPVAIKVFKVMADLKEADRAKLRDDFLQEGKLLAELSERSAAICQARDVGMLAEEPRLPYMVLEWLEGASLEAVLASEKAAGRPPRSLEQTLRLLAPIADALALAHRRGVAHRDIKPANIFLCGNPDEANCPVKLLDFGIAKVVQDAQKAGGAFNKTSGKITSFTPAYGAPEQFSRSYGATGPWTDVFAFALVLVECMTRREPLEGEDFLQMGYASSDVTRRPSPRTKGVALPDEVEAVFLKALAVNPAERFQTVGDFWEALRFALPAIGMQGLSSTDPRPARPITQVPSSTPVLHVTPPGAPLAPPPAPSPPAGSRALAVGGALVVGALVLGALVAFGVFGGKPAATSGKGASAGGEPVVMSAAVPVPAAPASRAPAKPSCPPGMIAIEGGRFFMGSDDADDLPFERPAHNVTLAPFCIDRYEVTVERYLACSDNGACKRASKENDHWDAKLGPHEHEVYDPLCNIRDPVANAKHPINCVDWDDAKTFCEEQKGRLPTEAEWEFAARGPDGRKFPWGDDPPTSKLLNACGSECVAWANKHGEKLAGMYATSDGFPNTAPVGSFPAGKSRYGLEDVVGNVWEWVGDWYEDYKPGALVDPKGPADGTQRVIRGGAWNGGAVAWVRPTFRYKASPEQKSYGVGFRCAKSL